MLHLVESIWKPKMKTVNLCELAGIQENQFGKGYAKAKILNVSKQPYLRSSDSKFWRES